MRAAAPPTTATPATGWLRRELGATFALSWPIVLANVAINVMTVTDFIMLGWLSPRALAAGALGFNLYLPPFLLGTGVVAALSPIAASKIGAGEGAEALRRATHQALLSALVIALVTWLALSQTTSILKAIGEEPDLAQDAGAYMLGFQWSLAPSLLFFAARSVFFALERPRPTLIVGLAAVAVNALANYALIFGRLGMPALGIFGSGLATTLSQTLMVLALVAASHIDPRMRRFRLFALPWRPARRELMALWRLGLPIGATIAAEVGVFSSSTLLVGLIDRAALEAHTIALQIASLAFMVPLGLGQAATVRVGHAYGARDAVGLGARAGPPSALPHLRAPVGDRNARGPPSSDCALHGRRCAGKRRRGWNRGRAPADRGAVPDLRRQPGDARQHAARRPRFCAFPSSLRSSATGRSARLSALRWDSEPRSARSGCGSASRLVSPSSPFSCCRAG